MDDIGKLSNNIFLRHTIRTRYAFKIIPLRFVHQQFGNGRTDYSCVADRLSA